MTIHDRVRMRVVLPLLTTQHEKLVMAKWEAQKKVVQEAREAFKTLKQAITGKEHFGGDSIGYLDLAIGLFAFLMPVFEEIVGVSIVDDANAPLLKAWFARFLDVDLIKTSLPPRDKMYELCKERQQQFISGQIKF
ncbi:hypothetical protein LUZ63_000324 [Rhynchospora breviuscula]|uniref:GST C-terminal domain-containing protein n=1 Tax=Rhynchospora breviuscula TaxID=2022672 RepID=A0A9Q0HWI9_9POAL|nr:hypothetical protein LUZ63_000324 [Rhynchospora breviuscula]